MKYTGILFILCMAFVSCHNAGSKKEAGQQAEVIPTFCKADTADVERLANEYLEHLKKKEFDLALQMLYHMRNDSILELSNKEREDLKLQYKAFPVLSYRIEGIAFKDAYNTEVMYSIEFFKREPGQENIPNTMNFRLNPQKIGSTWRLGVLNK